MVTRRGPSQSRTARLLSHAQQPSCESVTFPLAPLVLGLVLCPALVLGQVRPLTSDPNIQLKETSANDAKADRRKALNRWRHVIFNDDTYELSRDDANTPTGFLKRRLKPLVDTHVDTIAWSILGGWADASIYDSKVQPRRRPRGSACVLERGYEER